MARQKRRTPTEIATDSVKEISFNTVSEIETLRTQLNKLLDDKKQAIEEKPVNDLLNSYSKLSEEQQAKFDELKAKLKEQQQ